MDHCCLSLPWSRHALLGKFGFGQNIRDKFGNFTLLLYHLGVILLAKCYEAFFFLLNVEYNFF